jgi:hypothetical protein
MSYTRKEPKRVVPRLPTFYKAFGGDKTQVEIETGEIIVSSYILPGFFPTIKSALKSTQCDLGEIYIVCPQYTDKKTGDFADLQLSITGTPFLGEYFEETSFREIQEETGFIPCRCTKSVQRFDGYNRPVQNFWCQIDKKTRLLSKRDFVSDIKIQLPVDDKSRKIQIMAFGILEDLEYLLQSDLYPLPASDNIPELNKHSYISGIRLVSILDMMEILDFKL